MSYCNIDPNYFRNCIGKYTYDYDIKVILGLWGYRREFNTTIRINRNSDGGFGILEAFIYHLDENYDYFELANSKGEILEVNVNDYDEEDEEDALWIRRMIVGFEIVDVREIPKIN